MLIRMDKMNINGIANGDNTQNHDHSIYPVNFNPMNNIVNKPKTPQSNIVISPIINILGYDTLAIRPEFLCVITFLTHIIDIKYTFCITTYNFSHFSFLQHTGLILNFSRPLLHCSFVLALQSTLLHSAFLNFRYIHTISL